MIFPEGWAVDDSVWRRRSEAGNPNSASEITANSQLLDGKQSVAQTYDFAVVLTTSCGVGHRNA